jgi:glycogen(starch) synthase
MRVLHVLDMSLPRVAGYTSRTRSILENQAALGLEPTALTGPRQDPTDAECEMIGGIPHHRTRAPEGLGPLRIAPIAREIAEMAALGGRIREVQEKVRAEVFHAHSPVLCGIPTLAAARRMGVPFVYEIRAFWEDAATHQGRDRQGSARYLAVRTAESAVCRSADAIVAICDGIRQDLYARGIPDERISVVPNGVDEGRFVPRDRDEGLAERLGFQGKTVLAYVGTLFRFEGVDLFLEAMRRILDRRDDVRGLVVGYGEALSDLRARHAELGLGDRVVLTGKVEPADVARYYSVSDVLCYPRERHRITELTTPLKPLEAMCMGKAVVASDVGGLRELVRNGKTGLLHRAGDAEELAYALLQMVDVPHMRRMLGREARADVLRTRTWKVIAARYRDVYAAATDRCTRRMVTRLANAA